MQRVLLLFWLVGVFVYLFVVLFCFVVLCSASPLVVFGHSQYTIHKG